MATFYTDLSAIQTKQADAAAIIDDCRRVDSPVEFADAIYTIKNPTTEATNDIIVLVDIPLGAIVLPEHSFIYHETDPGTLLTVDIGDSVDPDRYADGADISAAGKIEFTAGAKNVDGIVNRHKVTATTRRIQATVVGTVTSLTAGTKIHFKVGYKCL